MRKFMNQWKGMVDGGEEDDSDNDGIIIVPWCNEKNLAQSP
jgi:hypothetical protein